MADRSTPEALIATYLDAFHAGDWSTCADLMDADALQHFRDGVVTFASQAKTDDELATLVGPNLDKATLRALAPRDLFVRYMTFQAGDILAEPRPLITYRVLGTLPEDTMAHVVVKVRTVIEEQDILQMTVYSTRREGDQWRMLLKGRKTTEDADVQALIEARA